MGLGREERGCCWRRCWGQSTVAWAVVVPWGRAVLAEGVAVGGVWVLVVCLWTGWLDVGRTRRFDVGLAWRLNVGLAWGLNVGLPWRLNVRLAWRLNI